MTEPGPLAIEGIDHVQFVVGNARRAAHFYRSGFDFDVTACAGPETGQREAASYGLAPWSPTSAASSAAAAVSHRQR